MKAYVENAYTKTIQTFKTPSVFCFDFFLGVLVRGANSPRTPHSLHPALRDILFEHCAPTQRSAKSLWFGSLSPCLVGRETARLCLDGVRGFARFQSCPFSLKEEEREQPVLREFWHPQSSDRMLTPSHHREPAKYTHQCLSTRDREDVNQSFKGVTRPHARRSARAQPAANKPRTRCQASPDLELWNFTSLTDCARISRFPGLWVFFFALWKRRQRFPDLSDRISLQLPNYRVDSKIIHTRNPEDISEQISLRMYWRLLCVTLAGLSVARALTGESIIVVSVRHGFSAHRRALLWLLLSFVIDAHL